MSLLISGDLRLAKGQPVPNDPYLYTNTVLLLHGDGTNGSTIIVDSSKVAGSPKTVTAVGDAQISTAESKFGGSSIAFDGTGNYLTVPDNTAFEFGSGDFTLETWAYFVNFSASPINTVASKGPVGSVGTKFYSLQANGSGNILFYFRSGSPFLTGSVVSANTWVHLAVTRSANVFTLWVNGSSSATITSSTSLAVGGPLIIGSQSFDPGAANRTMTGYIDDLRITKGVARYTANFTPPTAPFPDF
jgi:hypothetical protein